MPPTISRRIQKALVSISVLTLFAVASPAFACSCLAYPADEAEAAAMAYPKADAVFVGKVTAVKTGVPGMSRFHKVHFDVDTAVKGVDDDLPLVVSTAASSAACGYPFRKGETYLVFAFRKRKRRHAIHQPVRTQSSPNPEPPVAAR